jgi:hypothetical protein
MMCHDDLAPLFHPIGECFSVTRSSYTIVIVEVTGIYNSFDAKLWKMRKREEKTKATGKKPGGKPPVPPVAEPQDKDQHLPRGCRRDPRRKVTSVRCPA